MQSLRFPLDAPTISRAKANSFRKNTKEENLVYVGYAHCPILPEILPLLDMSERSELVVRSTFPFIFPQTW